MPRERLGGEGILKPEKDDIGAPGRGRGRAQRSPDPKPPSEGDPWDARRAEVLIASLKGVLSARVVASDDGVISEIHVLADAELTAKQVVRNVESALLAQLGVKLDHRKISVAQTAEVLPIESMEKHVALETARKRAVVFRGVEVTPTQGTDRVTVTVTLEHNGGVLTAVEDAGDALKMRVLAAARAAVGILDGLMQDGTVDLAGANLLEAFDASVVLVGLHVLEKRETRLNVGSCVIRVSAEQAAVLAVLDAGNRQIGLM